MTDLTRRALEAFKATRDLYRSLPNGPERDKALKDYRDACESVANNAYLDSICEAARGPYVRVWTQEGWTTLTTNGGR